MKKSELIDKFETAIRDNIRYVMVEVSVNGATPEMIINSTDNLKSKLEYYKKAYNDDLVLNTCENVRIVRVSAFQHMIAM